MSPNPKSEKQPTPTRSAEAQRANPASADQESSAAENQPAPAPKQASANPIGSRGPQPSGTASPPSPGRQPMDTAVQTSAAATYQTPHAGDQGYAHQSSSQVQSVLEAQGSREQYGAPPAAPHQPQYSRGGQAGLHHLLALYRELQRDFEQVRPDIEFVQQLQKCLGVQQQSVETESTSPDHLEQLNALAAQLKQDIANCQSTLQFIHRLGSCLRSNPVPAPPNTYHGTPVSDIALAAGAILNAGTAGIPIPQPAPFPGGSPFPNPSNPGAALPGGAGTLFPAASVANPPSPDQSIPWWSADPPIAQLLTAAQGLADKTGNLRQKLTNTERPSTDDIEMAEAATESLLSTYLTHLGQAQQIFQQAGRQAASASYQAALERLLSTWAAISTDLQAIIQQLDASGVLTNVQRSALVGLEILQGQAQRAINQQIVGLMMSTDFALIGPRA